MVSTDQAHSLGDVLGIAVPPTGQGDPVRVLAYDPEAGGGFLDALALDTLALLEGRWLHVVETLDRRFPGSELSSIAPEELCALPGIQEVLGLHAVGELAAARRWDRIVVDCASTADALRMLTLPATFGLYVERAWPRHRRLSIGADDGRSAVLAELLERIRASVERLSTLLTDGALVSAHLVLTPERWSPLRRSGRWGRWRSWGSGSKSCSSISFWCKTRTMSIAVCPTIRLSTGMPNASVSSVPSSTTSMPPSVTWHWCWCRTWPANRSAPRPWAGCSIVPVVAKEARRQARYSLLWTWNPGRDWRRYTDCG